MEAPPRILTRRNSQSVDDLTNKEEESLGGRRGSKHTRSGRLLAEVALAQTTNSQSASRDGSRANLASQAVDLDASIESGHFALEKKKMHLIDGLADKLSTGVRVSDPVRNRAMPMQAPELLKMLLSSSRGCLVLDVRSLQDFVRVRLRGSANISLPSLILKRIQRNVLSSFQLENFLTNDASKSVYKAWIDNSLTVQDACIVIADDVVSESEDPQADAFMVVKAVLGSQLLATRSGIKVFFLDGGLHALYELSASHAFFEGDESKPQQQQQDVQHHQPQVLAINTHITADSAKFAETPTTLPADYVTPTLQQQISSPLASTPSDAYRTPTFGGMSATTYSPFRKDSLMTTPTSTSSSLLGTPTTSSHKSKRASFQIITTTILATNSLHESIATPVVPELDHVSVITDYIMLGSEVIPIASDAVDQLKELGVTHVLNMAKEVKDVALIPGLDVTGIEFLWIGIYDHPDEEIDGPIRKGVKFIDAARSQNSKARILVHCKAGRSRSVAVVIGYLILIQKMTLKDAYDLVNKARKGIIPNIGFMLALKNMEMEVHGFNTEIQASP
ncbi:hypothetical protein BC830DRAFT_1170004 [Chytriomyces sp. MP71]|nr:hypothetical protein BC830DRAFT_1170004 [Chytriomyces sp. MP71]